MSTVTTEKDNKTENRLALEDVRKQVLAFGNEMHQYFEHVSADIENYKFAVEKHGEGIEVEVSFKAYVHPKMTTRKEETAKVIPR